MMSVLLRFAYLNALTLFFLFFLYSCRTPTPPSSAVPPPVPEKAYDHQSCSKIPGNHIIFSIIIDGADVGREVRTDFLEEGSSGLERIIVSHMFKNEKMGHVLFQTTNVRTERTDFETGKLIAASFVKKDQVSIRSVEISSSSSGVSRTIGSRSSFTGPVTEKSDTLSLSGDENIGYRLNDLLRKRSLGTPGVPSSVSFFEPQLNGPVALTISDPFPSTVTIDAQEIQGKWVEIFKESSELPIVRVFFDSQGSLWIEDYPELHETRQRIADSLSLPTETSELIVGLRSNSYIYDPSTATHAVYHLSATPDRLDALDLLDKPLNQSLKRLSPGKLFLEVNAGSPDMDEPPRPEDLGSSLYIQPKHPAIVQALLYLRSSGKRGRLSQQRRYNATPVIAQASLILKPKEFWSDPDKVAGLIMRYVSALLPDKRHTFSMADAVSTLDRGGGDCTEHSVLFASLMRSHGIPTRLVTGMFLTRGGVWAYHMWASYWNGVIWHSIDPSTKIYRTGALHVALGRGASSFSEVRDHLADFMWRTFNGVTFDLVEASNEGNDLFLARPSGADDDLAETALFNAVVLSDRGDHDRALNIIDKNIPKDSRSLSVKLMRVELLFNAGHFDTALRTIEELRKETSASQNTLLLDKLELKCLLRFQRFQEASKVYDRLFKGINNDAVAQRVLEAEYLFGRGRQDEAIALMNRSMLEYPSTNEYLRTFSSLVSKADNDIVDESLLKTALKSAWKSANHTGFVDHEVLATLSLLLSKSNQPVFSDWFLDHALILAPKEPSLLSLRKELSESTKCR